ncbi:hypothetical protein [Streptomyces sp. NPDC058401]|uniref:hypothetical protein n=1 Tax=Streptomyces sp. NPDC058401 TaxID=3346480 RepID=UPI003648FB7A
MCLGLEGQTLIEFKYFTRSWAGTVPGLPDGEYQPRNQAADDVLRHKFVEDIVRLERFCDRPDQDGLALLVTNYTEHLRGCYDLAWRPYSDLPGPGGTFQYLAVPVTAAPIGA